MFKPFPVPGFEHYLIDETGRVYNSKIDYFMKPYLSKDGYYNMSLKSYNGDRPGINQRLNRMVAMAHIPNPENYPIVLHLDNNKLNNNVENLKWGTYKENTRQAIRDGIIKNPERNFGNSHSDNRKYYILHKEDCPMEFITLGVENMPKHFLKSYNNNAVRTSVCNDSRLRRGQFKDWKIRSIDRETFRDQAERRGQDYLLNVEPLSKSE